MSPNMKNLQDLADSLNQDNKTFPFFNCKFDTNLCDSVCIKASKQKKEDWINGIYHNSPYVIIMVTPKASQGREREGCQYEAELLSWGFRYDTVKPMRKKTGSLEQIKKHLEKFFEGL